MADPLVGQYSEWVLESMHVAYILLSRASRLSTRQCCDEARRGNRDEVHELASCGPSRGRMRHRGLEKRCSQPVTMVFPYCAQHWRRVETSTKYEATSTRTQWLLRQDARLSSGLHPSIANFNTRVRHHISSQFFQNIVVSLGTPEM